MTERVARADRLATDRTPTGIHMGLGAAVVVAAVGFAACLPASAGAVRLAPVAIALVVISAGTVDAVAVAALVGLAYLLTVGFLVDQYGVLTWHGLSDVYRLVGFLVPAGAGLVYGAVRHRLRERRRFQLPREWITDSSVPPREFVVIVKEEVSGV